MLNQRADRDRERLAKDPAAWIVRTRRAGLRLGSPDGARQPTSQRLPLVTAIEPPPEIWFSDPLPDYVDWRRFVYVGGPGPGFVRWLAALVPPGADVVSVVAPDAEKNDWRLFGSVGAAPLIAERAWPRLPRRRDWLRQELDRRMPRIEEGREPGHHAPRSEIPMWEMNAAVAHDFYGLRSGDVGEVHEFRDYGPFVTRDPELGSRSATRYMQSGRQRLSRLGGWPWCLSDDGQLSQGWYAEQEYAEALALWHYEQSLAALAAVFRSIASAAPRPPAAAVNDAAREAALAAYHQWYMNWTV